MSLKNISTFCFFFSFAACTAKHPGENKKLEMNVSLPKIASEKFAAAGPTYVPFHIGVRLSSSVTDPVTGQLKFDEAIRVTADVAQELVVPLERINVAGSVALLILEPGDTAEAYCERKLTTGQPHTQVYASSTIAQQTISESTESVDVVFETLKPVRFAKVAIDGLSNDGEQRLIDVRTGLELHDPCTRKPLVYKFMANSFFNVPQSSEMKFALRNARGLVFPLELDADKPNFLKVSDNRIVLANDDDFDGDSISNANELIAGTDPLGTSVVAPTTTVAGLPVAVLTPSSNATENNLTSLSFEIGGAHVEQYTYLLLNEPSVSPSCPLTETSYTANAWSPASVPLSISNWPISNGFYTLCVISKNSAGVVQSSLSPSSYSWIRDTTAPSSSDIISSTGIPSGTHNSASVSGILLSGPNFVSVSAFIGSVGSDCNNAGSYPLTFVSKATPLSFNSMLEGSAVLCAKIRDVAGNESVGFSVGGGWTVDALTTPVFSLVISNSPGTVNYSATGSFTLTLSNTGGETATGINFNAPSTSWSYNGGTCGASLAGGASCTKIVDYLFNADGTPSFNVTVNANGGASANQNLVATESSTAVSVVPFFDGSGLPMAPKFNQLVVLPSDPFSATTLCSASTSGKYGQCANGGMWRKIPTNESSCANLTLSESAPGNWLNWRCKVVSGSATFYSVGLRDETRLADLIDVSNAPTSYSWKTKTVSISKNGRAIHHSPATAWWDDNDLAPLPNSSSATQTLNTADKIFVQNSNVSSSKGYYLAQDGIGIVVMPGFSMKFSAINTFNNCSLSGNTTAITTRCGLFTDKKFHWIEGEFDSDAADTGLAYHFLGNGAHRSLFRYASFVRGTDYAQALHCYGCKGLLMQRSRMAHTEEGFVGDYQGANASSHILITESIFSGIENSAVGFFGHSSYPGTDNGVTRSVIVGSGANAVNTGGAGVNTHNAPNTYAHLITMAQMNTRGFYYSQSNYVSASQVLALSNSGRLFVVDTSSGSPNHLRFAQIMSWLHGTPDATNYVFQLDAAGTSLTANLSGNLWHNHAGTYAAYTPDYNAFSNSAGGGSGWTQTNLATSVAGSIVGQASSDSVASGVTFTYSPSMILARFENPFRAILKDALITSTSIPSKGTCTGGTCRLFDYRIKNSDSEVRNKLGTFTPGAACPASLSDAAYSTQGVSNKYLYNAAEVLFDGNGDEDGLCESNEECIYQPNVGAYLGEGSMHSSACVFTDGANFQNIKMYGYATNGAP